MKKILEILVLFLGHQQITLHSANPNTECGVGAC